MKKLLVAGVPRLFQLARVFRNGERGATHHPEFTMLEWYRAERGYRDLMDDCEALLRAALRGVGHAAVSLAGGKMRDPSRPFERPLASREAFRPHCDHRPAGDRA